MKSRVPPEFPTLHSAPFRNRRLERAYGRPERVRFGMHCRERQHVPDLLALAQFRQPVWPGDHDDPMYMVRHHNPFINFDVGMVKWNFIPATRALLANVSPNHAPIS